VARLRVWVESRLHPQALGELERIVDILPGSTPADAVGSDGVVLSTRIRADARFFDSLMPSLKFVARPGIGVDNVDLAAATERQILVVNTPDAPSESTAEHAVALMLAATRRVVQAHVSLTRGGVEDGAIQGTELRGLTLGVIGYGRIGRRVAEICGAGLLMKVSAFDPFLPEGARKARPDWLTFADSLEELLAGCEVLTLHASLTEKTRHLIGARELGLMKRGAYLINVSRGPVVDEEALLEALEAGHLAGAALDVFEKEPPDRNNPLLLRPDVTATPHVASLTDAARRAMGMGIVNQINQLINRERPEHLVNPAAWPGRFNQEEKR
jgi:D-3-phosphoglycerate dehydrogenase / 2-oxoglutarate reductase